MGPGDSEILAAAVQFWESRGVPRRILYQAIIRRELREAELMIGAVRKGRGDQKLTAEYHLQNSAGLVKPGLIADNTSKTACNVASFDFSLTQGKGVREKSVEKDLLSSLVEYWEDRGVPKRYVHQAIIRRDIEETERRNEALYKQENSHLLTIAKKANPALAPEEDPIDSKGMHRQKSAIREESDIRNDFRRRDRNRTLQRLSDLAHRLSLWSASRHRRCGSDSGLATGKSFLKNPKNNHTEGVPERPRRNDPHLANPQADTSTSVRGPSLAMGDCDKTLVGDDTYNTMASTGKLEPHKRPVTSGVSELQFGVNDTRLFDEIPFIDDTGTLTTNNQDGVTPEDHILTACCNETGDVSHDVFVQTSLKVDVTFPFHKPKRSRVLVKGAFQQLHKILRSVRRFAADRLPCLVR